MKKRALALLLAVVMVVGLLPMTVLADENGQEPSERITEVQTEESDFVQIKKSLKDNEDGEDGAYTLTIESYVTGTIENTFASGSADIVLVLDVSDSMDDYINVDTSGLDPAYAAYYKFRTGLFQNYDMRYNEEDSSWQYYQRQLFGGEWRDVPTSSGNIRIKKINALRIAANKFISGIYEDAAESGNEHRISIVTYGDKASVVSGLLPVNSDLATLNDNIINGLILETYTHADLGMAAAETVLAGAREDANKVVVMFTDGQPRSNILDAIDGFNERIANAAIKTSDDLKKDKTTVFTVGIFEEADRKVTAYMNRLSSNYEDATTYQNGTEVSDKYYLTAETSDDLSSIFANIAATIVVPSVSADGTSVLTDTLTANFEFVGEPTVTVYNATGTGDTPDWEEDTDAAASLLPVVDGKTITLKGFDYSAYPVVRDSNDSWSGKKVVLSFGIQPVAGAEWETGTSIYDTNDTDENKAGLIIGEDHYEAELEQSPNTPITTYEVKYSWTNAPANVTLPENNAGYFEGSSAPVDSTFKSGDTATLDGYTYTFSGWCEDTACTSPLDPEEDTVNVGTSDVTLYGNWTKVYTEDVTVTVTGFNTVYDGNAHTATYATTGLPDGFTLEATLSNGSLTDAGEKTASIDKSSIVIKDADNNDVTSDFDIDKVVISPATVKITPIVIHVNTTASKVYNGNDQTMDLKASDADRSPVSGQTLTVNASITGKAVGKYTKLNDGASWDIENGKKSNYDVTLSGTLSIITADYDPSYPLTLTKVDADDTSYTLSGAQFELYRVGKTTDTKIGTTYKTDKNGVIRANVSNSGEYYWVEVAAPIGYKLDSETKHYTSTESTKNKITVTNEKTETPPELNGDDHFAFVIGYPDGMVQPEANITRAEVATIFFRLLKEDVRNANMTKENNFSDVDSEDWFCTAVSTMAKLGIVNGYPNGSFAPSEQITRAEFAAIAARFDKTDSSTTANFADISGHWAELEICKAAANGWVNGYSDEDSTDTYFKPDQYITRSEAMALINRVLNRNPENTDDLLDDMIKWADNMNTAKWYYIDVQEATNGHNYDHKANNTEHWTKITEAPDWAALEK